MHSSTANCEAFALDALTVVGELKRRTEADISCIICTFLKMYFYRATHKRRILKEFRKLDGRLSA